MRSTGLVTTLVALLACFCVSINEVQAGTSTLDPWIEEYMEITTLEKLDLDDAELTGRPLPPAPKPFGMCAANCNTPATSSLAMSCACHCTAFQLNGVVQ